MDLNAVISYMSQYGIIFLIVIVFLEYLNLPGFPAGIIMPVAGIWISSSGFNFWLALLASIVSALIASWILYLVGRFGGNFIIEKYMNKFPKQRPYIEKKMSYLQSKGSVGVFVSKLIPMARTIIGIPAGMVKLNFIKYTISSMLGIFVWNIVLIGAGFLMGNEILKYIG